MTLLEMSAVYADSAARLRLRITELQTAAKREADPKIVRSLNQRVEILIPLLREMRELADLTAHYYDKRCCKHDKYIL
jgi:hypothetical protein